MDLVVVASIEQELAGLRKQLRRGWRPGGGGKSARKGNLSLDLQVIGMGEQAGVRLRSLLEKTDSPPSQGLNRPAGLLLLGVAGAVDPGLETGDLVLSARYYRQDSDENSPLTPTERQTPNSADPTATGTDFLAPDPDLWQWATAAGEDTDKPVVFADSLTVNDLVATPWDKQAIGDRYPVGIVNMEDYRVAAVAQEAGVPFISARAILDPDPSDPAVLFVRPGRFSRQSIAGPVGKAVAGPHISWPGPTAWDRPACPYWLRSEFPDPSFLR